MNRTRLSVLNGHIRTNFDYKKWLADRPDGDYIIEVDTEANKTSSQLGYYFGALIPLIMEWTGYAKTEADHHMRVELLGSIQMIHKKKEYHIIPSVRELSKAKMSEYINDVYEFCITHGLNPQMQQEY